MKKKYIDVNDMPKVDNTHSWFLELGASARYLLLNYNYELSNLDRNNLSQCEGHSFVLKALADKMGVKGQVYITEQNDIPHHFFFKTNSGLIIDAYPEGNDIKGYQTYISHENDADPKYDDAKPLRYTMHYKTWKPEIARAKKLVNKHMDDFILLKRSRPLRIKIASLINWF